MGKPTGFLEFERAERTYDPVEERVKHWRVFVQPLPEPKLKEQAALGLDGLRHRDCGP